MKIPQKTINIILLSAIAIAVILRITNLGSREFWYDEVLSLLLSTGQKSNYQHPKDVPVILANYTNLLTIPLENSLTDSIKTLENFLKGLVAEPHPFLFFLEQHFWLRLWGNSEAAMRSIVALFSLGSLGCAYGLGRYLLGSQGGLLFAALLGLNPYYLFHSLNVRMYGSLIFWVLLSSWSLLELISFNTSQKDSNSPKLPKLLWILLLIISATAGFMTFYYFACWFLVLAALVFYLDKQRWWQYALYLTTSIIVTIPWLLWGTRQQLRNADLARFASPNGLLAATLKHLQEFIDVLGIHLLIGDWVSILPTFLTTLAGILVLIVLSWCSWCLYKNQQYRLLIIGLILGIFPLIIMLTLDVITGKFTLGFGWGRSVIFVLPGCLLLLVIFLEKAAGKFKNISILAMLILYLSISIADFSLRPRWMFHQVADIINQEPNTPTLIVMNSPAWGHVLRLAYYLPPTSPISLLAQKSATLGTNLEESLKQNPNKYQRIIWLDSARPVWGKPSTETEKQQVKIVLGTNYKLEKSKQLLGTGKLDDFTLNLYQKVTAHRNKDSLLTTKK
ncbi:glycosyltransferase family 39 protein [Crocosphaera sp. XPORK-15E]|uniref:glycosyltransferase family 39 protein n=1 Tax=Crocosphaera sp. XPORK-15E TaxID=3110247 RepID=UPI002B202100|nr:glycosyltransferase family 39 protein [Crocosphaera sp. XPORK-15E]MEA5534176.1 glycosyltransferase family 39 protein [Crocosphaera sp. XPORK-15E]